MEIEDTAEQQVWEHCKRITQNHNLSKQQKEILGLYFIKCKSLSPHTVRSYLYHLKELALWSGKLFKEITRKDIDKFLDWKIEHAKASITTEGRKFKKTKAKPRTLNDYIRTFKAFFRWLFDLPVHQFPDCVKDLKLFKQEKTIASRKDLLTKKDFKELLKLATDPQKKCYLLMSLEGAYRRNELRKLTVGRVIIKENHALVLKKTTKSKNPGESIIPHVIAKHSISGWLNEHPFKDDNNAPFFIPMKPYPRKEFLSLNAMNRWIERLVSRSNIRSKVTPHRFRHLRVTLMKLGGKSNEQIRLLTGHCNDQMINETYGHMDNEDKVNEYLAEYGIIEEKPEDIQTNECIFCGAIVSEFEDYCPNCKSPPNKEAVEKEQEKINDTVIGQKDREIEKLKVEINEFKEEVKQEIRKEILREILKNRKQ